MSALPLRGSPKRAVSETVAKRSLPWHLSASLLLHAVSACLSLSFAYLHLASILPLSLFPSLSHTHSLYLSFSPLSFFLPFILSLSLSLPLSRYGSLSPEPGSPLHQVSPQLLTAPGSHGICRSSVPVCTPSRNPAPWDWNSDPPWTRRPVPFFHGTALTNKAHCVMPTPGTCSTPCLRRPRGPFLRRRGLPGLHPCRDLP